MDLKKSMKNLMNLSDRDFGNYLVSTDPIEGKLTKELREEIIEKSIQCGYDEAEKIRKKTGESFGEIDIFLLAKDLGITVKVEKTQNVLDYIYFGTYEEPGIVTLYEDNIKKGEDLVSQYKIQELLETNLMEIILSHEIFHFLEAKDNQLFVNTFRIKLWKLGPYTHTSGLICTGEIAGMAFARKLLNLKFCPNLLDVLLLYPHDKEQAESVYKQIMKYY
ncbi:MAG TPA: hypothetical protein VJY54_05375 [Lachnospiraceae bacterium]|nr:hypothetical protein [Lachnospiraceae bacterium]